MEKCVLITGSSEFLGHSCWLGLLWRLYRQDWLKWSEKRQELSNRFVCFWCVKMAERWSRDSTERHDFTVKIENLLILGSLKPEACHPSQRADDLWMQHWVLSFSLSLQLHRWSFCRSVFVSASHPALLYWYLSETSVLRTSRDFFFKVLLLPKGSEG